MLKMSHSGIWSRPKMGLNLLPVLIFCLSFGLLFAPNFSTVMAADGNSDDPTISQSLGEREIELVHTMVDAFHEDPERGQLLFAQVGKLSASIMHEGYSSTAESYALEIIQSHPELTLWYDDGGFEQGPLFPWKLILEILKMIIDLILSTL